MSVLDALDGGDAGPRATTYSQYVAWLGGALAIVLVAPGTNVALPVVATGSILLGVAANRGDRTWLTRGYAVAIVGALLYGAIGGPPIPTVGSVLAVTVAWDAAENGIGLAEQLGHEATTERAELVHATAVTAIGAVAGGAALAVSYVFANNQPRPALVLLLFATVLVLASLRRG